MSGFRATPNAGAQAGSAPPASTLSQPYWRDVHSKTHGCIKATFTVLDNLDSRFRYGLFANPGQHHGSGFPAATNIRSRIARTTRVESP